MVATSGRMSVIIMLSPPTDSIHDVIGPAFVETGQLPSQRRVARGARGVQISRLALQEQFGILHFKPVFCIAKDANEWLTPKSRRLVLLLQFGCFRMFSVWLQHCSLCARMNALNVRFKKCATQRVVTGLQRSSIASFAVKFNFCFVILGILI